MITRPFRVLLTVFVVATLAPAALAADPVADELAIRNVVDGIDSSVDDKDWTEVRALFADRVAVDFTSLVGGEPATIAADDLVAGWRTVLYDDKISHHMRTNHRVAIDGDRATVVSRGYAFNALPSDHGDDLWEVWGVYRHTLARTDVGWKVDGMTFEVSYARGNERARTYVPPAK